MKKLFLRATLLLVLIGIFLAGWAFWWEPRRLVVREDGLSLPCWTGAPLRVAILTDLHVGAPYVGVAKLERVVQVTNEGRPDLVVLLGDFVIQDVVGGDFVSPERIAATLKGLRAPLGVYAVLGNHDHWLDAARVERALESEGIPVIEDEAVRVDRGGASFWLVGVSDYWTGRHDVRGALSQVSDGAPVVVITHNPDVFPIIPKRVCLTLAGHTHGGQVAFPIVGRLIVPSHYGQDYAIGYVHEAGRDLYVAPGVGTSIIPVRFRVPPEVLFLEVH